jgi:hypothetical protein
MWTTKQHGMSSFSIPSDGSLVRKLNEDSHINKVPTHSAFSRHIFQKLSICLWKGSADITSAQANLMTQLSLVPDINSEMFLFPGIIVQIGYDTRVGLRYS